MCGKANRTLGLVKRTLHAAPQQVRKTAYETLARPSLEYATCAWSPHTQSAIKKVEQVQRAAARFVCGDYRRRSSVTSMCGTLEWDTLEQRRRLRDVTQTWTSRYHLATCADPCRLPNTLEWDTLEQRRRLRDVTQTWTSRYHLATCADPCRLPNSMSEHRQATSSDIFMPHLPVLVLRPLCTSLEPPTPVGNRRPDSSTVPDGRLPNHQSPVMFHVGF